MALLLKEWLSILEGISNGLYGNAERVMLAKETIAKICCYFEEDLADYVAGIAYNILFNEGNGFISFIQIASTEKTLSDHIIIPALTLIKKLIGLKKCHVLKYVKKIQDFCWKFWRVTEVSSQKEEVLEILILIISLSPGYIDPCVVKKMTIEILNETTESKSGVLQKQYHMMGIMAKMYPEELSSIHEKILEKLLDELVYQLDEGEDRLIMIVAGCLDGISEYLDSFPLSPPKQSECSKNLKKYERKWLVLEELLKIFLIDSNKSNEAILAGLKFLGKHASYISNNLLFHYKEWNVALWRWGSSDNFDESKLGEAALESFYHEISLKLVMDAESTHVQDLLSGIKLRMQPGFWHKLRSTVKSIGYFSSLLKTVNNQEEIEKIFIYLFQHQERLSFRSPGEFSSSLFVLPAFLEAIGRVIGNMDEINMEHVVILQKLTINLVENIPALHPTRDLDCLRSLILISYSLSRKPMLLETYLENILAQSLIISCSPPPINGSTCKGQLQLMYDCINLTICKNYTSFWKELFKATKSPAFKGMSAVDYANTMQCIFAHLLKAALTIIDKLDLKVSIDDDGKPFQVENFFECSKELSDGFKFHVSNTRDMQILVNLIHLLCKILSTFEIQMGTKNLNFFMTKTIYYSENNPLISGFCKLLSTCLSCCNSVNYFEALEITKTLDADQNNLFNRMICYLKNISLQVNEYDNGLQVSHLEVLLSTPTALLKHLLTFLAVPVQTVFRLGLNNLSLVIMGIEALEKWTKELSWVEWNPVLNEILPSLNYFLNSSADSRICDSRRKYSVSIEGKRDNLENGKEVQVHELQRRVILFFAKLPPSSAFTIAGDCKSVPSKLPIAWNPQSSLTFKITLPDMKLCLYLDKFLPRIIELSLSSNDGKTRITACELLYTILMYHFGRGEMGETVEPENLCELSRRLTPTLLQLGCDSNTMIRQFFHQLLLQLSNLFSIKCHLGAQYYAVWIECLMDGLSHPHNTAVREISGICLKEFMEASLKHSESKELSYTVVDAFLGKIYKFSQHPSPCKIVGASLAINHLYAILCDNEFIVDQFWLELLYCQVLALEKSESFTSKLIITTALRSVGKVLKLKADIFNKNSTFRKKPPSFEGVLLKDAVYWLLNKCNSQNFSCREESMTLYLTLAPCVEGCSSPKDFVTSVFESCGLQQIINICEGVNGLLDKPSWIPDSYYSLEGCSKSDLTVFTKWLNSLHSSLDCYIRLFMNNLCEPSLLFTKYGNFKIFDAVSNFLSAFMFLDVNTFKSKLDSLFIRSVFQEGVKLIQQNSVLERVSVQIVKYLTVILDKSSSGVVLQQLVEDFWISKMWNFISSFFFEETFRDAILNDTKTLHLALTGLIQSIKKTLSVEIYQSLLEVLADNLQRHYNELLTDFENAFFCEISIRHLSFVKNLLFLHECCLLADLMKDTRFGILKESNIMQCAFNALFENDGLKNFYIELNESKLLYIETFLKLSFLMNPQVDSILALTLDDTEVEGLYSQKIMAKGEYFYLSFKSCILTSLSSNLQNSVEYLFGHLKTEKGEETLHIWTKIWSDLISHEKAKLKYAEDSFISSNLSFCCFDLLPWSEDNFLRTLTLLRVLVSLPLNVINQDNWLVLEDLVYWCINLLVSQTQPFMIKAKVLKLVPYFNHQKYEESLRGALQSVFNIYFTSLDDNVLNVNDFNGGTINIILKTIFIGLENTCNPALLRFFVKASNGGCLYVQADELKKGLSAMMEKADTEKQFGAISTIYSFALDDDCDPGIRIASVRNFVMKLIEVSNLDAAVKFFAGNIKNIVKLLQDVLVLDVKLLWKLKLQLVSKIICFHLMEKMFLKFGKRLGSPSCPISVAYNNEKANEKQLIRELTRRGWEARKTIDSEAEGTQELFRQYRCAAYNALVAVISNLKEEEKFYYFLFQENLDNGDLIWEGLVDTSKDLVLSRISEKNDDQLFYDNPIYEEGQGRKRKFEDMERDSEINAFPNHYMQEYPLEAKRYDFTDCTVRSLLWAFEGAVRNANEDQNLPKRCSDGILDHECMIAICGLIKHMVEGNITPLQDTDEDSSYLPIWVRCIKTALGDSNKHRNIKIFLMTVILKCEKFFAPYANHLLMPVMESTANGNFGQSVNYLFENVVKLILSWATSNENLPVDSDIASKLLELFFINDGDLEREMFTHYLQLIRSILGLWDKIIEIPECKIMEQLKKNVKNSKYAEFGLLISCILMEHSITPWKEYNRNRFLDCVLDHLENDSGGLHFASACLTGLILRQMDPDGKGINDEDDFFFEAVIKILMTKSATYKDNFLLCLNEIQKNYSNIIDRFLPDVFHLLPKLSGKYKTICLEIISRRKVVEFPFSRLKDVGLFHWLSTSISKDKEIALNIIKRNLSELQVAELREVLDHLYSFHHHPNVSCRRAMYEILKYTCEKYGSECGSEETDISWVKRCEEILLLGLVDDDPVINDEISSFWRKKQHLRFHNTTFDCFVTILQRFFSPNIEKYFLEIMISLLLLPNTSQYEKGRLYKHSFVDWEMQAHHPDWDTVSSARHVAAKEIPSTSSKEGLQRRLPLKDWQKYKASFSANEIRRTSQRVTMEARRHQQREAMRGSFRQYHFTDFSDVQYSSMDILLLLKALSKKDAEVGRQLFVSLIGEILATAVSAYDESSEIWVHFSHAVNKILKEASVLSNSFIGAILEISQGNHNLIKLDPEMVVLAGEAPMLSPLACLYIEGKLSKWLPESQTRMFYDRNQTKDDTEVWLHLTKLYQHMGENDVVHGIFHDFLETGHEIKKTLELERKGHWTQVMTSFQEVLNLSDTGNFVFREKDYYYEGYFKCLANLSQWEQLNREVNKQLSGSFARIWDNSWFSENLLPWLFTSQVRIGFESQGKLQEFYEILCSWMEDKDKGNYIQTHFCEELAAVYFLSDQWDQAKYYIGKSFDLFLQEWSNLMQFSTKEKRVSKLLDIQLLGELSMFLSVFDSSQKDVNGYKKLYNKWTLAPISHLEPLRNWEQRIASRNYYISKLKETIDNGSVGDSESFSVNIQELSGKMVLFIIETASAANNFQVAKKYLKMSESMLKKNSDPRLRLPWHISYGYLPWVQANSKCVSCHEKMSSLLRSMQIMGALLNDCELTSKPDLKIDVYNKMFVLLQNITAVMKNDETTVDSLDHHTKKKFLKCIKSSSESLSLMDTITEYGSKCMGEAIEVAETLTTKSFSSDLYLSMAKYCIHLIKVTSGNYEETCMKSLLRAILYGSSEARHWFPCLLQFDLSNLSLKELFKTETSRIPPWMFLCWTNQILAHLNGSAFHALEELVTKLADTYPDTLLVPYRLNIEKYKQSKFRMMHYLNQRYKIAEELICSLAYICQPELMFSYHLEKIISLLDAPNPNICHIKEAYSHMMTEVFPAVESKKHHGALNGILQIYKKDVTEAFGFYFHSVENVESIRTIAAKLTCIKRRIKKAEFSVSLENYSCWLAHFRSSDHSDFIEIPGQYSGESEPLPEFHTKIHSFLSTVSVVPSLKDSICITILGSDGKEHKYLIKYGKDFRPDERIGHIMHIMNRCLSDDLPCMKRDLRLDTFQFIPLSSHYGMIKWSDGMMPLTDVISMSMKENESKQRKVVLDRYHEWLKKVSKKDDTLVNLYRNAFLYYGRDETVTAFQELVQMFPCDVLRNNLLDFVTNDGVHNHATRIAKNLHVPYVRTRTTYLGLKNMGLVFYNKLPVDLKEARRSFLLMSQSLEDFWSLRYSFATSYAALCVSHWLLGVGKCDAKNIFIQRTNGRVASIDLGYSFGSSIHSFAVPELMPFRLTPQILGLMQPFGEIGLIKEIMVHTLRALQSKHDILLSVVTVFVNEPFLDWLVDIRRENRIEESSDLVGSCKWNPEKTLMIAERKFVGGINPAKVTLQQLDTRNSNRSFLLDKIKDVVRGKQSCNIRAMLDEEDLSCEQQVSCLIDMAIDYHILGKTWSKWEPWL